MRIFMVFRECLEALTVCTRNEEIVQYHGRDNTVGVIKKFLTIMLEAVASQDLWIWHAFFGIAGANNDINVLVNSSLFDDLVEDITPAAPFVVNGVGFENGYYLADKINRWRLATGTMCMLIRQEICNVHGLKDLKFNVKKQNTLQDIEVHLSLQQNLMEHIQLIKKVYEVKEGGIQKKAQVVEKAVRKSPNKFSVLDVYEEEEELLEMQEEMGAFD
ncbi:ALP1-like protein [Tanacetum coccineum]